MEIGVVLGIVTFIVVLLARRRARQNGVVDALRPQYVRDVNRARFAPRGRR